MDSDRSDQPARSQQARSTAAQLQSRLVAVARGLTDSYEEAARKHEQSAVDLRPPTEVDHRLMAKTCRVLADRTRFIAQTWEEQDECVDNAMQCPHCALPMPREFMVRLILGRSATAPCPSCGATARLALHAASGEGDDHTEDLTAAIVHEKLRIASGLNDEVVSHLFAAALRLDGALAMTYGPVRQCLIEAIDHVDVGIHAIRQVAFGLAAERKQDHWGPARHRGPRQDGPD
jgi:rubrerythrin